MLENIKNEAKKSIVIAILLLIFAVILMTNKENFIPIAIEIIGYIFIIWGILSCFLYLKKDGEAQKITNYLKTGIILFLFGTIAILKNALLENMVTLLLSGFIFYQNSSRVQISLNMKAKNKNTWLWIFLFAIMSIAFGYLMLYPPILKNMPVNTYLGLLIILSQLFNLIESLILLLKTKEI